MQRKISKKLTETRKMPSKRNKIPTKRIKANVSKQQSSKKQNASKQCKITPKKRKTVCYFMCKFFSVWKWGGENVADDGGGGGRLQSTEYFHKTGKVQK